ncbi:MAG TPA: hypothetical protein VMW03_10090 [Candidatus Krumholzibacteriaceae bacterium]|nr:hypothetical protein [Candidatus Krumholzibacteriaceae bacterium]
MNSRKPTLYVTKGVKNSEVFEAVKARVEESGASTVVVGSTKGASAIQLSEALGGMASVVSVTEFTYSDDVKKKMKKMKVAAVEKAGLPIQDNREMRETLMMFSQGVKATLEVAAIAVGKGLAEGDFIAVAGGDKKLDTAILVSSEHPEKEFISDPLKRMLVKEVIALKGY